VAAARREPLSTNMISAPDMMPPIYVTYVAIVGLSARKTHLYRAVLLQRKRRRQQI
jgi:hypothetical protein